MPRTVQLDGGLGKDDISDVFIVYNNVLVNAGAVLRGGSKINGNALITFYHNTHHILLLDRLIRFCKCSPPPLHNVQVLTQLHGLDALLIIDIHSSSNTR